MGYSFSQGGRGKSCRKLSVVDRVLGDYHPSHRRLVSDANILNGILIADKRVHPEAYDPRSGISFSDKQQILNNAYEKVKSKLSGAGLTFSSQPNSREPRPSKNRGKSGMGGGGYGAKPVNYTGSW